MALSTSDIAKHLSTSPKTLRQFLRSRNEGVGSGARYEFTTEDLASLGEAFEAWMGAKPSKARRTRPAGVDLDAPGLDLRVATPDDISSITTARIDRLEEMLRAKGMHVSQMKDHHTWHATTPVPADA